MAWPTALIDASTIAPWMQAYKRAHIPSIPSQLDCITRHFHTTLAIISGFITCDRRIGCCRSCIKPHSSLLPDLVILAPALPSHRIRRTLSRAIADQRLRTSKRDVRNVPFRLLRPTLWPLKLLTYPPPQIRVSHQAISKHLSIQTHNTLNQALLHSICCTLCNGRANTRTQVCTRIVSLFHLTDPFSLSRK
jgi:hypothetical protein